MKWLSLALLALAVSACSTRAPESSSRYQHARDFTPQPIANVQALVEPIPKAEPISSRGNAPRYRVWGKEYQVITPPADFREQGIASWYGMKFHGHETSNGEIYDVYQFTAAHKSLPLPSYVRVTRVDNGSSVVVRVNDRGPFHEQRIIDLSYAAAVKLDMHRQGVADVVVELLQAPLTTPVRWVQVGAVSQRESAQRLQQQLITLLHDTPWSVSINEPNQAEVTQAPTLYRVRIGPVPEGADLELLLQRLAANQFERPLVLGRHQL
ncbi:MAG: septal ring lytic transglycosylase RlpA family protein [Bacterioplanes sp.]|nr:septal ring lytic transglycosylase RlpA family protein [Bacterioplanes sp.]